MTDNGTAPKKQKSANARTMELLREEGYLVAMTERWNAHAGIRQDLFGFVDCIGVRDVEKHEDVILAQSTTDKLIPEHVAKIKKSRAALACLRCGFRIVVFGWRKNEDTGLWECRQIPITAIKAKLVEHKPKRRTKSRQRQKELF